MNDANNAGALLPCPFCKSRCVTATRDEHGWKIVECDDCGARGPCINLDGDQYIDRWNALSTPNAPAELAGFENIEAEIKDRGFDAEMSKNLADIVRISVRAGKDAATSEIDQLRAEIASQAKALSEAEAERDAARDSAADSGMLAFKWMERHDRIAAGKDGGEYPTPADVPNVLARALAAEARLAEAMKVIEPFAVIADRECSGPISSLLNAVKVNLKVAHLRAARAMLRRKRHEQINCCIYKS